MQYSHSGSFIAIPCVFIFIPYSRWFIFYRRQTETEMKMFARPPCLVTIHKEYILTKAAFQYRCPALRGPSFASTSRVLNVRRVVIVLLLLIKKFKKYEYRETSRAMMFMPNFVKIGHLVQELKEQTQTTWQCHKHTTFLRKAKSGGICF
jgi:hypothetical protein